MVVHHEFRPDDAVQILEVGATIPWHACALGHAMVAALPEGEVDTLLAEPLRALTGRTRTSPEALRKALGTVRTRVSRSRTRRRTSATAASPRPSSTTPAGRSGRWVWSGRPNGCCSARPRPACPARWSRRRAPCPATSVRRARPSSRIGTDRRADEVATGGGRVPAYQGTEPVEPGRGDAEGAHAGAEQQRERDRVGRGVAAHGQRAGRPSGRRAPPVHQAQHPRVGRGRPGSAAGRCGPDRAVPAVRSLVPMERKSATSASSVEPLDRHRQLHHRADGGQPARPRASAAAASRSRTRTSSSGRVTIGSITRRSLPRPPGERAQLGVECARWSSSRAARPTGGRRGTAASCRW